MLYGQCHGTHKHLSTYIFDIMKLKILVLLNCEAPKYVAKLFSLGIYFMGQNVALDSVVVKNEYCVTPMEAS